MASDLDPQQQAMIDRLHKSFRARPRGYRINDDAISFDPQGRVNIANSAAMVVKRHKIPMRFGWVNGYFYVEDRGLTTLENSPEQCSSFYCQNNPLSSLRGGPREVTHTYNASECELTSLDGAPESVADFSIYKNRLTSLVGCPRRVAQLNAYSNPLTTLDGLPESAYSIKISITPQLGLLRLLLVKGLEKIEFVEYMEDNSEIEAIIKRYLGRGANGVMPCAAELIKAGYRGNARL
jgi:hypothetical protein